MMCDLYSVSPSIKSVETVVNENYLQVELY